MKRSARTRQPITTPSPKPSHFTRASASERKAARLRYLKDRWARRLERVKGVRVLTPFDPSQSCGLASVSIEGIDPIKVVTHLWDNYRILVTPLVHPEFKAVRVTPNVYTTLAETDFFADVMEKMVKESGQ